MQTSFVSRSLLLSLLVPFAGGCGGSSNKRALDDWADTGGSSGKSGTGGTGGTGGSSATGGSGAVPSTGELGSGEQAGLGTSSDRYYTANVSRNGIPYLLITNGWGPGFQSHTISWHGTSFIVETMSGTQGANYQPASYPSVFCGKYSVPQIPACGLPAAITALGTLMTGWRWAPNGNAGSYNAAYDIWLGDGSTLQSYLMVWLRDPPGAQPAGGRGASGVAVAGVSGTYNLWTGTVNGLPIVNYARQEGSDVTELEFDVLNFVRDAKTRNLNLPGTHVNAVAVGFEIWSGPIMNLETKDFYVDPK